MRFFAALEKNGFVGCCRCGAYWNRHLLWHQVPGVSYDVCCKRWVFILHMSYPNALFTSSFFFRSISFLKNMIIWHVSSDNTTGAHLLCYPGAFNMTTGPLHWELLQRARYTNSQSATTSRNLLGFTLSNSQGSIDLFFSHFRATDNQVNEPS